MRYLMMSISVLVMTMNKRINRPAAIAAAWVFLAATMPAFAAYQPIRNDFAWYMTATSLAGPDGESRGMD